MALETGLGSFIDGSFLKDGDLIITSHDPSHNFAPVFSTKSRLSHIELAIKAARKAHPIWSKLEEKERILHLLSLKDSFNKNAELIAQAISKEMGKVISEARLEAKGLGNRIELMINQGLKRIATENFYELRAKTLYHSQGVLAVLGPYNFPAHLINAHLIPAIITGNTVIYKPSEICPLVGELYAKCVAESSIPKGVVNMVQGDAVVGKALSSHPELDGVLFTGSYQTGRALKEQLLDQPHKILALELGGKNFAVVMDDADIEQALAEIIQGAFLTTGQRCSATSRVLIHENIFNKFKNMLVQISAQLAPGKAMDEHALFGPLASKSALNRFCALLDKAKSNNNVNILLDSKVLGGGAFVTPSIYEISKDQAIEGYLGEELFGPNLCLESFSSLDEAIKRVNQSPYGLANTIFSLNRANFERMFYETKSGVLNFNRSTNGALGQLPFGGVNKSGNQRPAGIEALRYTTFPVAICELAYGESSANEPIKALVKETYKERTSLNIILLRHQLEYAFEVFGIISDYAALDRVIFKKSSFKHLKNGDDKKLFEQLLSIFAKALSIDEMNLVFDLSKFDEHSLTKLNDALNECASNHGLSIGSPLKMAINVPEAGLLPRSKNMLDRLYYQDFVPKEKKAPVIDLYKSHGPFMASVDDNPLVLFDAASQIATLSAGFMPDILQNAYDCNEFDHSLLQNVDLSKDFFDKEEAQIRDAVLAKAEFERFLLAKANNKFLSVSYGASGAEANEIAFDLCRQNGPGGTRIIAFNGAFHGRTLMSLQATYNKEKRGPFEFNGYQATFLAWPETSEESELKTLNMLKDEIAKGNICCVIIESMQCEGGDNYASNRFFTKLRLLTKSLNVPLVFDEVQTGFHLGNTFYWYQQFKMKDDEGNELVPDCLTLGKKAQLGVCLSVWPQTRKSAPHVIQLKRGLLQAQAIDPLKVKAIEEKCLYELNILQKHFKTLVFNPRAVGLAFAFDMPTNKQAMELINQRFERGFMAYIAGEKTIRFRMNVACDEEIIEALFEQLSATLIDMKNGHAPRYASNKESTEDNKNLAVSDIKITELDKQSFAKYLPQIEKIENAAYEEGRRDSMASLESFLNIPDSVCLILNCKLNGEEILGGYAFGIPMEHSNIDGPKDDYFRNDNITFYSANITLDKRVRGAGLGSLLKTEQIRQVARMKKVNNEPRYLFMSSRNRVGLAKTMTKINESYGAYAAKLLTGQYQDKNGQALFCRLPLRKNLHLVKKSEKSAHIDAQNSVENLFDEKNPYLLKALASNYFRPFACSKLTLSNWATPNLVRYSELLREVLPCGLSHSYFTSGRDEVVDKGLRSLRFHRPEADKVIGFSHQWFGHITAAARTLSHDEGQKKPFAFFEWPKVPHPGVVGEEQSLKVLNETLALLDKNAILGIVVELMGERSALTFSDSFLTNLHQIREKTGIPLVFAENAASYFRNGHSIFLSHSLKVSPNMVWWYSGGQLGHVFVDDQYFVPKPLTLISTWDGDEISMVRSYYNLLYSRHVGEKVGIEHISSILKNIHSPFKQVGQGAWHGFQVNDAQVLDHIRKEAYERGVFLGKGFDHTLMVCPPIDIDKNRLNQLVHVLNDLFSRYR